jgi:hypothetical protein
MKGIRITPQHVKLAMEILDRVRDEEHLKTILKGVVVPEYRVFLYAFLVDLYRQRKVGR